MKKILLLFILLSLFLPSVSFADCSKTGTTVIFINGIFGDENAAKSDRRDLEYQYKTKGDSDSINFINSFNPSHAGGLDDLAKSIIQAYRRGYVDFDLTTMLRQLHGDLKTQKILLVGHSQGTFYTNAAYNYLVEHGVDKKSISVYNVATPADRVEGGGEYLTSSTDELIDLIVRELTSYSYANRPLPANIDIEIPENIKQESELGHSFSKVYMGLASDRIISDIDNGLDRLAALNENKDECFIQPEITMMYRVWNAGYKIVDNLDEYSDSFATSPFTSEQMANFGKAIEQDFSYFFSQKYIWAASLFSGKSSDPSPNFTAGSWHNNSEQSQEVVPIETDLLIVTEDDSNEDSYGIGGLDENLETEQDIQDVLDNIQEKIDIISRQVQDLVDEQNQDNALFPANEETPPSEEEIFLDSGQNDIQADTNSNGTIETPFTGGGGETMTVVYPKILISEIQTGVLGDSKKEFVELYNPNDKDVALDGWYLQRKTGSSSSWSTYASSSLFLGKKILANGYFLIARTDFYPGLADIYTDSPITDDNSFVLKNPNREASDKLGFGSALDPEAMAAINPGDNKSIGRKVYTDGTEQDTDNNLNDFELDKPTPKAKNITYIAPIEDKIAPVITLSGIAEVNIHLGDDYTDAGATAIDDVDGEITVNIVVVNPVDVNTAGDYNITYNVSDAAGNSATEVIRIVHVSDKPAVISNDTTVTSEVYTVSPLVDGVGTLTGVAYETSTADFEKSLVKGQADQVWNDSGIKNPVATGDVLVVTAQDEITTATYMVTVDKTNWSQGTVDSFTPDGVFVFHTSNFIPNVSSWCDFSLGIFRDVYPSMKNGSFQGGGSCSAIYPTYRVDLSSYEIYGEGEYNVYLSYCGGADCKADNIIGNYFRIHFDGTSWTNLPVDETKVRPSSSVELVITNYYNLSELTPTFARGVLSNLSGGISNVHFNTPKADFETAFTPATGSTLDFSNVADPVISGNKIIATAEDGKTTAEYKIIVDPVEWQTGIINSYTPDGIFYLDTSYFTDDNSISCNSTFRRSLYPYRLNEGCDGSFPCGDDSSPVYTLNLSREHLVGDYTIWMYDLKAGQGRHYEFNFDGIVWKALGGTLSDDATISSAVYTVSPLVDESGTITNVPFETAKADFETAITLTTGATADFSNLTDPVTTGGTVVVTAQDGTTKSTYTITVNDPPDTIPPSIITYTISNSTISPNGDGVNDSTEIDWEFSEKVKADVDILNSEGTEVVKDFYKSYEVKNPEIKIWDGKDNLGAVVPDGVYTIRIVITDFADNSTTDTSQTIIVDTAEGEL